MWKRVFTTALCLISFGSELVLDGSTAFVRETGSPKVGQLSISSTNPIENHDLPVDASPETPDWAKSPSPSHTSGVSQSVQIAVHLFIVPMCLFSIPDYQNPDHPVEHRPPITAA